MKRIFTSLLIMFLTLNLLSQTIYPYSVNSCGSLNFVVGTIVTSDEAGTIAIIADGYSEISFLNKNDNLSIFPNPSSNIINILPDKNVQYKIYDISEKMRLSNNTSIIDISKLEKGMYFLKTEKTTIKFIKK